MGVETNQTGRNRDQNGHQKVVTESTINLVDCDGVCYRYANSGYYRNSFLTIDGARTIASLDIREYSIGTFFQINSPVSGDVKLAGWRNYETARAATLLLDFSSMPRLKLMFRLFHSYFMPSQSAMNFIDQVNTFHKKIMTVFYK